MHIWFLKANEISELNAHVYYTYIVLRMYKSKRQDDTYSGYGVGDRNVRKPNATWEWSSKKRVAT